MEDLLELCRPQIQLDEGLRLSKYRDTMGNETIGYGHKLNIPITQRAATIILEDDLANAVRECMKNTSFFNDIDIVRKVILVNMCFNEGIDGLLNFEKMLMFVKTKKYILAATEIRTSKAYRQVPNRMERLAKAMELGKLEL